MLFLFPFQSAAGMFAESMTCSGNLDESTVGGAGRVDGKTAEGMGGGGIDLDLEELAGLAGGAGGFEGFIAERARRTWR